MPRGPTESLASTMTVLCTTDWVLLRACRVPIQHPQGAQSIPAARPSLALVRRDRHPAGILGLQGPSAAFVTLRGYERDRLGNTLVGHRLGATKIVEAPQDVVMPPRRKGEATPLGAALAIPGDQLTRRPAPKETALEQIFLAAQTSSGDRRRALRPGNARLLELQQRLEHADRGVEG